MSAPRILALDLATVGGIAYSRDGLAAPKTEFFDLAEMAEVPTHRLAREHGRLLVVLAAYVHVAIEAARPDVVAVEKDTGRNVNSVRLLAKYRAVVELACAARGIRCITDIAATDARKLAGLPGGGTDKARVSALARMVWGLSDKLSDDEVDAIVLLRAVEARLRDEAAAAAAKAAKRRAPRTRRRAA